MKPGEDLIRVLIQELNERISRLNARQDKGEIGPGYARYQRRWIRAEFARLEGLARRYGYKV
jgi:hypothetical protein